LVKSDNIFLNLAVYMRFISYMYCILGSYLTTFRYARNLMKYDWITFAKVIANRGPQGSTYA